MRGTFSLVYTNIRKSSHHLTDTQFHPLEPVWQIHLLSPTPQPPLRCLKSMCDFCFVSSRNSMKFFPHMSAKHPYFQGLKPQNTPKERGNQKDRYFPPSESHSWKSWESLVLLWCTCSFIQPDISCWLLHKCTHSSKLITGTQKSGRSVWDS